MRCNNITKGYKYSGEVVASISSDKYKDVGSPKYDFVSGTGTRMTNFVAEKGYRAAAIKGVIGTNAKDVTASGYWNPDTK